MSHTYVCLPSHSWYSFTDPGGMEGLSRSRCEVSQAEIRTCNLPTANPALYHTATSTPYYRIYLLTYLHTLDRGIYYALLSDVEIYTVLWNITVVKGNQNTTVTYHLTDPYVGRTINNRNVSLTPEQRVTFYVVILLAVNLAEKKFLYFNNKIDKFLPHDAMHPVSIRRTVRRLSHVGGLYPLGWRYRQTSCLVW